MCQKKLQQRRLCLKGRGSDCQSLVILVTVLSVHLAEMDYSIPISIIFGCALLLNKLKVSIIYCCSERRFDNLLK
jgi:hypothetical protein